MCARPVIRAGQLTGLGEGASMASGGQEVAVSGLRFWVLGSVGVTGPSGPLALGGPRQRAVLALLLAHPGQVVGVGDLLDGLWAEDPPRSAERTLHAYISRLRSVLGGP